MIDPKKRSQAVARIIAGESSSKSESMRLRINERTVEKWVAAARKAGAEKTGTPAAEPVSAGGPAPEGSNPALDAARAALDPKGGASSAAPTPSDLAAGREDMAKFCLDTIGNIKLAVGGSLVQFKYSPPLEMASKEVQGALALGLMSSGVIRANAERLYPVLVKWMSGPYQLFGALAFEGLMMIFALHSLAVGKGWESKSKEAPRGGGPRPMPEPPKERKPFEGVKSYRPQDLGPEIARARSEMKVTPRPEGLPDTSSPTTGTINAVGA